VEWLSKLSLEEYNQLHLNTKLSLDTAPDAFDQYIESIHKTLPAANKKPVYITEWNFTPSHREWLNDTCFSSVYIVRNILTNYDKLDSFCHWSLTDWIEEMVFSQELFHGGMGFFTRNGIKKPAYHAYSFLSKLENQFVSKGDGYFVTKGDDRYVILLYYYVQISDLYAQGVTFNTTFTERYHPFDHANDRMVDFVLSNMEDGTYLVTEHIVNRHYGSVFDKWLEMGGLELKKQEDVETLRQLSAPMVHKKQVTITDNLLPYSVTMEPLEIRLIEIEL
jgi:xylan 1,4-beta-xylosidase